MKHLQLSNMYFFVYLCMIQLRFNWAYGEPILGDNVRDAMKDEFSFVVSLSRVSNELDFRPLALRQFCAGSLITMKHVLTAEHCLLKTQVQEVEVLAGSTDLNQCKAYDPEKWTTWQEWMHNNSTLFPPYHHDVAVITLKNCVFEEKMIPTILSKSKPKRFFGKTVKMAGWGLMNHDVKPTTLKTADLTVLSNVDCQSILSRAAKENVSLVVWHVCAKSEPWALSGCGDSGGPLINHKKKIIGVTLGICPDVVLANYPGEAANKLMERRVNLFASLHYYQDFISHFTNENYRCSIMK